MRKLLGLIVASLLFGCLANAQTAVVSRDVYVRPDPSTNGASLALLKPGTSLELLEPHPTNGFLHVKTADGTNGWTWSRNVKIQAAAPSAGTTGISATTVHLGPAALYPNPTLTTGVADTLSSDDLTKRYTENCPAHKTSCTYSQAHRDVPDSEHKSVYDEYSVPQLERNRKDGEVDHFYPLCAGGSNDIKNLWYQPATNLWNGKNFGYHEKDKLETYICVQIKNGKLDPKDAYDRITTDWVQFYLDEGLDDVN